LVRSNRWLSKLTTGFQQQIIEAIMNHRELE
jgi:hypothetical protein